ERLGAQLVVLLRTLAIRRFHPLQRLCERHLAGAREADDEHHQVLAALALEAHAILEIRLRAAVAAIEAEPARVDVAGAGLTADDADEMLVVELREQLEAILAQHVERTAELRLVDVTVELADEAGEVERAAG